MSIIKCCLLLACLSLTSITAKALHLDQPISRLDNLINTPNVGETPDGELCQLIVRRFSEPDVDYIYYELELHFTEYSETSSNTEVKNERMLTFPGIGGQSFINLNEGPTQIRLKMCEVKPCFVGTMFGIGGKQSFVFNFTRDGVLKDVRTANSLEQGARSDCGTKGGACPKRRKKKKVKCTMDDWNYSLGSY